MGIKEKSAELPKLTLAGIRQEKLIELRLQGKSVAEAARQAGYAESTRKGKIYQIMDGPEYQARIKARIDAAGLNTDEIIGTLVGQLRFDMAPLFPDDAFWQRAHQLGLSAYIKKYRRRPIVAGFDKDNNPIMAYEIEVEPYSSQAAAKHLTRVFGQEQLPAPNKKAQLDFNAAVEEAMQEALEAGVSLRGEELRKAIEEKMRLLFPLISDANN